MEEGEAVEGRGGERKGWKKGGKEWRKGGKEKSKCLESIIFYASVIPVIMLTQHSSVVKRLHCYGCLGSRD